MTAHSDNDDLARFVSALIAGDSICCGQIVDQALARGAEVLTLYEGVFKPALYQVGTLWSENQLSVANEHLATAITEGLMNRLYPRFVNPNRAERKVLLALVAGELHQVGIKMVADVFELHGWDALYPGVDLSIDGLLVALERERPELLGLSLCVRFHLDILETMLKRVRSDHPNLPILIGGQGLDQGVADLASRFSGVRCIYSLTELHALIPNLHSPCN